MSLTAWWNFKHTILKSGSLDEIDKINAGKTFKIRYLGCCNLGEQERCDFSTTADRIVNNIPRKMLKKLPVLKLFIDSKSLSVSDTHSPKDTLFEVSLSDVRDILYRKRDRRYGNVCIFVARHIAVSSSMKAHVLYCDTSKMAEELFETFRGAFHVFDQTEHVDSSIYPEIRA
jgi:hypothetical protein